MNFWQSLPKPIIGLAPMDGVTDAPFREVVDMYGKPSVLFTEFVSVDAITHNPPKALIALEKHKTQTPLVAQLYGRDLESYQWATIVVCELGFDGIDINMGCPAKSIASRGAGAGLIREPSHACAIIKTVYQTVLGWGNGNLSVKDIPTSLQLAIKNLRGGYVPAKRHIPISVKTRIGYDSIVTKDWTQALSSLKCLSALIVHGRTLKQGYGGEAQWEEIQKASDIAHAIDPNIVVLGNGDVASREQAEEYYSHYHVDGVLVGRRALGNPWVFTNKTPSPDERMQVALVHAQLLTEKYPQKPFITLRKHMPWYIHGIAGAAELRNKLSKVNTYKELGEILQPLIEKK